MYVHLSFAVSFKSEHHKSHFLSAPYNRSVRDNDRGTNGGGLRLTIVREQREEQKENKGLGDDVFCGKRL